ncbi:MAG TPA: hypothetical protein VE439_04420 [Anaerolineae bacterium]|jgi:hypothetical protein|nr:hypothetical protein [Anaerolineae bacterium]
MENKNMSLFTLSAGASSVEMKNLANLNFAEMVIEGGAASYKLDFGGSLQRNGYARVTAGVSSADIYVPALTAAKITTESPLGSLHVGDGFTKKEGAFWTKAAVEGSTPVLTIYASVALGALDIRVI